jgi:acetate kinase
MTQQLILVINCGSSSLKFALYTTQLDLLAEGLAESLNSSNARLKIEFCVNKTNETFTTNDHKSAIKVIITELQKHFELDKQLLGIGHRIVHGGDKFKQSTLIDAQTIKEIERCTPLAPLHNPANLLGIKLLSEQYPSLSQVAVFDTSFHQSMPPPAFIYAIPYRYYEQESIRRYGFHGTSHRYVSHQAAKLLNKNLNKTNLIIAHLGNGASVASISNGKSVDTSMGLTPLEGLVMGTRSGDIDPGLYDYLISKKLSPEEISRMLNKESGLLGISGVSNDMRTLCEKASEGHKQCQLAIDIFCFRLAKYVAAMMVSLDSLDALVFTGGIGENSALVRVNTIKHLAILGFSIDESLNNTHCHNKTIHAKGSRPIMVIPTDEEVMIVKDTLELIPGTF